MIRVILRGGLGNQMFQYAAGLATARKNNTGLVLDTAFLNDRFPRRHFTYRTYDLDIFTLEPVFTFLSGISKAVPISGIWLGMDLAFIKLRDLLGMQKLIREKKEHEFDPSVFDSGNSAALWGFWQTPEYFSDIESDLQDAFRFRHGLKGEALRLAEKMKGENPVALHVRRGDYALPKYEKTYGETGLAYYDRAVAYIAERVPSPTFYVFSDDIEWCRQNLRTPHEVVYVARSSEGPKASYHLQLMSLCKHNVIANSTFSWWGAWLNQSPEKIVVAPRNWFVDGRPTEIVPENWIKL